MIGIYERKLLEKLVGDGVLQRYQMEAAIRQSVETGSGMGRVLVASEMLTEETLDTSIPLHAGLPFINLSFYEVDPATMAAVPEDLVRRHALLPVDRMGDTLTIAFSDAEDVALGDELSAATGYKIVPLIGFESDIREKIRAYYPDTQESEPQPAVGAGNGGGFDPERLPDPPPGTAATAPESVPAGNAPFIRLARYRIDSSVVGLVPGLLVRQYTLMPVDCIDRELTIAVCSPPSVDVLEEIRRGFDGEISFVRATRDDILDAIHRCYDA